MKLNSMIEHEVFHLDREQINQVAAYESDGGESKTVLDKMKSFDMTLPPRQETALTRKAQKDAMDAKLQAASSLLEEGFYTKVAEVKANSLQEVLLLTKSLQGEWCLTHNKNVRIMGDRMLRDTGYPDLLRSKEGLFIVMPLGFMDVERKIWV